METEKFFTILTRITNNVRKEFLESPFMEEIKDALIKKAESGLRSLDVKVNTAGNNKDKTIGQMEMLEEWALENDLEVEGTFSDNDADEVNPIDRQYKHLTISW